MNRSFPAYRPRRARPAPSPTSARTPASRSALRLLAALGLAGLAGAGLPLPAQAQVSRCVDRQGNSVFTDRPCEAVDSASRIPQAGRRSGRGSAYRGACARSLPMLIHDLTSAIESGDANRLGMLYLWAGVSDADAVRTFNRLQSIVERPLVDIVPLRREVTVAVPPAPPAAEAAEAAERAAKPPAPPAAGSPPDAMRWAGDPAADRADGSPGTAAGPAQAAASPPGAVQPGVATTRTRSVVTGLRLQQTAGRRATSVPVVLGLRRAYDCWWISLPGG